MPKPRKRFALWITAHILKILACVLVFAVIFAILWRVFISNIPPKEMKQLQPTAQLAEAYRTHGDDLSLFTQTQPSVTKAENNYGYFGITRCIFIPEAKQIQLVVRYNDSTLTAIQADRNMEQAPPKGVQILDVTLIKRIDLTPEDLTDNTDTSPTVGKERYWPTGEPVIETTTLYTYCLYTFDNVTAEDAIAVFADIYYKDDVDYNADPYGILRIYHTQSEKLYMTITDDELEALQQYGK